MHWNFLFWLSSCWWFFHDSAKYPRIKIFFSVSNQLSEIDVLILFYLICSLSWFCNIFLREGIFFSKITYEGARRAEIFCFFPLNQIILSLMSPYFASAHVMCPRSIFLNIQKIFPWNFGQLFRSRKKRTFSS